ncbi:hypothetical protein [Verrucomicrobium spinosum]|uniref:hypothetical protein n=1 Tax=Verrucomicrobium spinosum TaxID=2736 RepID=UPI00094683AE|nr:hypothetical protein [Verrucomicrobium spinosum]
MRELPLLRLVDEWVPNGSDLAVPTAGIARYARQLIRGDGTLFDPEFIVPLRHGNGAPNVSLGNMGDSYLDRLNGWFYEKTAPEAWVLRGVLALQVTNVVARFVCPDGQTRELPFARYNESTGELEVQTPAGTKRLLLLD